MAPIEVHGMGLSAPCRIVYMTCEVLGLEYNMVECDLMNGGNKTPEYLKMNPQHTIPAMKDGDFCLNESRVIATYLVNKHGKDDKLYPKETVTRALVDQRLYFDMGVFYKAMGDIVVSFPLSLFSTCFYLRHFSSAVSCHVWRPSCWR